MRFLRSPFDHRVTGGTRGKDGVPPCSSVYPVVRELLGANIPATPPSAYPEASVYDIVVPVKRTAALEILIGPNENRL